MNIKRYVLIVVLIVGVLALLYAAAWHHDHPTWTPMPKELTKPDPSIDRSRIPLGPYMVDFSGLIGGPTGDDIVTFYVVMRPGDVHLQRQGEVGKALDGASVTGLSISYPIHQRDLSRFSVSDPIVDGLRLRPSSLATYPKFEVPPGQVASHPIIRVTCSLGDTEREVLAKTYSFQGVKHGSCGAHFFPRPDLYGYLRAIQPEMLTEMSSFLPKVFKEVSNHIKGGP